MADAATRLEEFASLVVAAGPCPGEIKANGQFLYTHCPFPGPEQNPHQHKGGPQVSMWMHGGDVVAHCNKCLGTKEAYSNAGDLAEARAGYTVRLKERVGWQERAKLNVEELRVHVYFDRNLRFRVLKRKVKADGREQFWWSAAALGEDLRPVERPRPIRAEEFLAANYTDFDHMHDALHWYGIEQRLPDGGDLELGPLRKRRPRVLVIGEGEKDCNSFNAAVGIGEYFATCLSHPKPGKLRAHHLPLLEGVELVIIIPDKDVAGAANAKHWLGLVWDAVPHAGVLNLPDLTGQKGDKDLSDWLEHHGSGYELHRLLADVAPSLERPLTADEANSSLVIGPAIVRVEYKLQYWTPRGGFYSDLYKREMRPSEIRSNRAILGALEATRECPRDNLGAVKPKGARIVWRDDKDAIIGELMKQLPSEAECKPTEDAAEVVWAMIASLMYAQVTINPGSGDQRHAVGSWALRFMQEFCWTGFGRCRSGVNGRRSRR